MMSKPKLVAVGDNCLDIYLAKNEMTLGGNALNVALHWHNLGADARYFGALGQDREAEIVLNSLKQAGFDAGDIERREGQTAITLIASEAGERRFLLESLGVGDNYFPSPSHYQQLRSFDFVHIGTNIHPELLHYLCQDAIKFSIDLSTHSFDDLELAGAELVLISAHASGGVGESFFKKIRQKGAKRILVTCGDQGVYYHDGHQTLYAPAHPVEIVDTCGAGDSFLAHFVWAFFFEGQEPQTALTMATSHAARTCTYQGGFFQPIQLVPQWLRIKYAHFTQDNPAAPVALL